MNQQFRAALIILGALILGFIAEMVAYGQTAVVTYTQQPVLMYAQPPYPAVTYVGTTPAPTGEGYLRAYGNTGGVSVQANYGCGQNVSVIQGSRSFALETNRPEQGFAYALEVDRRATCEAADAVSLARKVAPVMVTGNPCPQQCCQQPIRGYCGRIVGYRDASCATPYCATPAPYCTPAAPYCATSRPTCASPCGSTPYWCGRTHRWCAGANYWCGRTNRWCYQATGQPCAISTGGGGSCCSGGRNPMVSFAPGDPRAVCYCRNNPNRGGPCACRVPCPECQNDVPAASYVAYGR